MTITLSSREAAIILLEKVAPVALVGKGEFNLKWVIKDGGLDSVSIELTPPSSQPGEGGT